MITLKKTGNDYAFLEQRTKSIEKNTFLLTRSFSKPS